MSSTRALGKEVRRRERYQYLGQGDAFRSTSHGAMRCETVDERDVNRRAGLFAGGYLDRARSSSAHRHMAVPRRDLKVNASTAMLGRPSRPRSTPSRRGQRPIRRNYMPETCCIRSERSGPSTTFTSIDRRSFAATSAVLGRPRGSVQRSHALILRRGVARRTEDSRERSRVPSRSLPERDEEKCTAVFRRHRVYADCVNLSAYPALSFCNRSRFMTSDRFDPKSS